MTKLDNVYTLQLAVDNTDIDVQGRVSNIRYVAWMQDAAVAHSTDRGWTMKRYASLSQGWVVRQHTITYKRPAFSGDIITVATWIAGYAPRRCLRRYAFWRLADKTFLAEAETQWVFIDMKNGKPVSVPQDILQSFAVVDADAGTIFRIYTS